MSNDFLKSYDLAISTLSPVHIGCGEDYEPTNYVIDDDVLYSFDASTASLSTDQLKKLNAIVSSTRGDMLGKLKKFFFDQRESLIPACIRAVPVASGVQHDYQSGLENSVARLAIDRMFANPHDGLPVIPGSSIKGAIRTALLDKLNAKNALPSDEKREAERGRASNGKFQERLMSGKFSTDALRLLKVGDARYDTEKLHGTHIMYAVSRRKKPLLKTGVDPDTGKGIPTQKECVPAKRYRAFRFSLACEYKVHSSQDSSKIPPRDKILIRSFEELAGICNAFYLPLLQNEMELLSERGRGFGEKAWVDQMSKALSDELGQRLKNKQACLLRVGRHSGAVSVTVEGVRHIKIMQAQGTPPLYQSDTKQVWLAANTKDARSDMLPFGWVLIEPAEQAPINGIADWFARATQQETNKLHAIQQGLAEKRQAAAADLLARQQREAEQTASAARQAQEEAARQTRLATLTGNQKEIEKLRQKFASNRSKQAVSGALYADMSKLLNAAIANTGGTWTEPEKMELADLVAAEHPKHLNLGGREKEVKKMLRELRGEAIA